VAGEGSKPIKVSSRVPLVIIVLYLDVIGVLPSVLTAHYHRSQQQEPAPVLFLVSGDGQDARAIHESSMYIYIYICIGLEQQHSC